VFGREPITTTEVEFSGTIIDTVWNKYDRGVIVLTEDHRKFKVGGTNTTSSIASQVSLFRNVPIDFWGEPLTGQEMTEIMSLSYEDLMQKWMSISSRVKLTLRIGELAQTMRRRFYTRTPHRLKEFDNILINSNAEYLEALPDHEVIYQMVESFAKFIGISQSKFKVDFCNILSLVDHPVILEPLCLLLEDSDPLVRREAALSFRSGEELLQVISSEKPELVSMSITTVTNRLRKDDDAEVRVYVTEDLGYFADKNAVQALIHALQNDGDEHVRWASAVALARYEDPRETFIPLTSALEKDKSILVQRSAMLGLGRLLARIRVEPMFVSNYASQLEKLKILLLERLNLMEKQPALSSYAAYAIGELSKPTDEQISSLIDTLRPEIPFEIRSNSTLALTRHFTLVLQSKENTEHVISFLEKNLSMERPTNYPSSAYFDWFLEYAGELLVKIEARELAAQYYQKAAFVFQHIPWRANYYAGIAEYEFAEYWFRQGEIPRVLDALDRSVKLFEEIRSKQSDQETSEKTKIGIDFRVNMAEARKSMILAISEWRAPFSSEENSQYISDMFNEAARRYYNVLRAEIEFETGVSRSDHKSLSKAELNLVRALTSLVSVGVKIEQLSLSLLRNDDDVLLRQVLGQVDTEINRFRTFANDTQSNSLIDISSHLVKFLETAYAESKSDIRPLNAIMGNFTWNIKQIFMRSLPTPAVECRIIGPGQAVVRINLDGAISGTGIVDNPYLFPGNKRLIFKVLIDVVQRAKNEQLIFRDHNSPAGFSDRNWIVHVHEGTFPIAVDYGVFVPAESANCFEFSLEFRNSGCSDPIYSSRIWVRVFDPLKEFVSSQEVVAQQIKSKEVIIKNLDDEIKHLETTLKDKGAYSAAGKLRLQELGEHLSQQKIELQQLKSELTN
jgi:HEAT repeat protein